MAIETTRWFNADSNHTGPSLPSRYALTASYSIEPDRSPALAVDISEPADDQTSLTLYEYVDPDALEDIIADGSSKRSNVEVRFTIEEYLVVRSTGCILIYEPIEAR